MKNYKLSEIKEFGFFRVAGAISMLRVADIEYNLKQYLSIIELASDAEIDFLIFPDLSLTGITLEDLFLQDILLEKALESVDILQKSLENTSLKILFTIPQKVNHKLCKIVYILSSQEKRSFILPVLSDSALNHFYQFNDNTLNEYENVLDKKSTFYFSRKPEQKSFHFAIYQSLSDFQINYAQKVAPCELNIILSEKPEIATIDVKNKISALADLSKSCIIYLSPPFGESTTDFVFSGRSYIFEKSKLLAKSSLFESDLLIADIDLEILQQDKYFNSEKYHSPSIQIQANNFPKQAKATISQNRTSKNIKHKKIYNFELYREFSKNPFLPDDEQEHNSFFESVLNLAAYGLVKRLKHLNDSKIVLGLSGGSDSTLALLIALRTVKILGQKNKQILCVNMPGFGTTKRTFDNTIYLAKTCGASYLEIKIHDAINQHFKDIKQDPKKHDITYENAQARERTQILMDLANQRGGIVLGTGDLSESALGFVTYGGDHLSMYHINAGIPKTLLRHLIRYEAVRYQKMSDHSAKEFSKTLFDILDTPVSPELLPPKAGEIAQKTEHIVGPYELHDYFLYYFLKYNFKPRKILFMAEQAFRDKYDQKTILHWLKLFIRRFFNNQFKRSAMPDGPSVLDITLSPRKGLSMPSDAISKVWLDDLDDLERI